MKKDKIPTEDNISKVLNDPSKVTQIIQSGIRDALLKQLNEEPSIHRL